MSRLEDYLSAGSRLTADPFRDLRPRRTVTPEEQSLLDTLGETSLGGLAYVGKLADKAFGGRAIRGGILGGHPRELLSILPLSDTLGLTDERDIVYGKKLLEDAGILTPEADPSTFGWNDAAGIAADIALDPATYLGFGTLTKAGTLAAKAGATLPRSTASRIAGFGAREADLAAAGGNAYKLAKQLGLRDDEVLTTATDQLLRNAGLNLETRFVPGAAGLVKNQQAATPLAGALGVGLPFAEKTAIGTGEVGRLLATYNPIKVATLPLRMADRAIDSATGFSPGRSLRALFDPSAKGLHSAAGQELGEFATRTEDELRRAGMGEFADHFQTLDELIGVNPDRARTGWRYARAAIEGAQPVRPPMAAVAPRIDPALAQQAAAHFTPAELAEMERVGQILKGSVEGRRATTAGLGVESPVLTDPTIEYFLRSQQVLPRQPGEKLWSYLTRFNEQYGARHASQIAREDIFKGVPYGTAQLNRWATDPALSGLQRTLTPLQAESQIASELMQAAPGILNPQAVHAQASSLADWLGRLPSAHAQHGVPFFSDDLMADFLKYAGRDAKARSAAETTYEAAARFSEPIVPGAPNADTLVPLDRVMREIGLTGTDAAGQPIAPLLTAQRLGISPNDLARTGIPAELYRDLRRLNEAWSNPKAVVPILAAMDAVSTLFKTHVTAAFPSFHTRNLMSALFNQWRSGEGAWGALDPEALGQAFQFVRGNGISKALPGFRGTTPQEWTRELTSELIAGDLAYTPRYSNTSDIVGQAGEQMVRRPDLPRSTGRSFAGDVGNWLGGFRPRSLDQANPLAVQGVLRERDVFTPVAQMRKAGQMAEDFGVVSHYMALRKQGWSPQAAAVEVKKFQGQNRLTEFDEQVMKRLAPWWRFSKNNLPPLLEQLAKDPAKIAATMRGITEGREPFAFIPGYVAESASVPLPGAPEGQQRYITSFGLPVEDEAVRLLGSLSQGNLTRAGQSALGMTMPYFKNPLEMIFGVQLYSGRRLQDLKPSETISLGGAVPEELARKLTQVVANSPAGRTLSTADKLIDDRKGVAEKAINLLTGGRISDIDIETQKPFAMKRLLEDLLSGQPGVRRSDAIYLSKKAIDQGRVSPEEKALYDLYTKLDSQIRRQGR